MSSQDSEHKLLDPQHHKDTTAASIPLASSFDAQQANGDDPDTSTIQVGPHAVDLSRFRFNKLFILAFREQFGRDVLEALSKTSDMAEVLDALGFILWYQLKQDGIEESLERIQNEWIELDHIGQFLPTVEKKLRHLQ